VAAGRLAAGQRLLQRVHGDDAEQHREAGGDGNQLDAGGALAGLYAHRLNGECKCGTSHGPELSTARDQESVYDYCDEHGALLIVNDRADLALACGADGVHVGQDDEPLESVRATVGADLIIGISTHSPEQLEAGLASVADYLGVGPVYATPTKAGRTPVGLELVRYAAEHAAAKPWFAIGGIDAGNAPGVVEAGASRIAVVRAIRDADDPRAAAAALARLEAHVH